MVLWWNSFKGDVFYSDAEKQLFAQSKIRVIQCDNQVRSDVELRSERDIAALMQKFTVAGGGSTDFRPVFSYVNDLIERGELKILVGFCILRMAGGLIRK